MSVDYEYYVATNPKTKTWYVSCYVRETIKGVYMSANIDTIAEGEGGEKSYIKYIEELAAAFLKHSHLRPDEVVAMHTSTVDTGGYGITTKTWFEKRTGPNAGEECGWEQADGMYECQICGFHLRYEFADWYIPYKYCPNCGRRIVRLNVSLSEEPK